MKKTNKKKWFSGKKQLHESSSTDVSEVVKNDSSDKIEENIKQEATEAINEETEVINEETEALEAVEDDKALETVDKDDEVEETSHPKNSRLARLDGLKERMNRKKTWK